MAGTHRGCTVVIADNLHVGRFETSFEIRTNRGHENHEQVFVGRTNTDLFAGTNQQRTQIKGAASSVRRNIILVELNNLPAGFLEEFVRNGSQHNGLCGALQTSAVFNPSEDTYFAIFSSVAFQSFESRLAIVQTGGSHVHRNLF